MFTWRRVRFFQVLRVFDAMARAFYQLDPPASIAI